MFHDAPLNNEYLELSSTAYAQITALAGMNADPRTIEVLVDATLIACSVSGATDAMFFGKKTTGPYLSYDDAGAGTAGQANAVYFETVRNAVQKQASADATVVYGTRSLFYGRDDMTDVRAYKDGVLGAASVMAWTAAQASYPLTTDANPLLLGKDGTTFTHLRLYELAIRVSGIVVCHVRPKRIYAGTTTVPDLSGWGNDLAIVGTEGTNFGFHAGWDREPMFTGKETVK